jgi:hypothetical protein
VQSLDNTENSKALIGFDLFCLFFILTTVFLISFHFGALFIFFTAYRLSVVTEDFHGVPKPSFKREKARRPTS